MISLTEKNSGDCMLICITEDEVDKASQFAAICAHDRGR
jgi:hypothetical protein